MVLTQPQPRVAGLAINLAAAGHEATTLGFQRIVERVGEPKTLWQLRTLNEADWIIPVSPNAVDALASFLNADASVLTSQVALIGPGSLERWQQAIPANRWISASTAPLLPRSNAFDGSSLMSEPEFNSSAGKRIVIIQAGERRPLWADELVKNGAHVEVVAAYRVESMLPTSDEALQLVSWLSEKRQSNNPIILASSVVIAAACTTWIRRSLPVDWQIVLEDCLWLANHSKVEQSLLRAGWRRVRTITPGERGLLDALESLA